MNDAFSRHMFHEMRRSPDPQQREEGFAQLALHRSVAAAMEPLLNHLAALGADEAKLAELRADIAYHTTA